MQNSLADAKEAHFLLGHSAPSEGQATVRVTASPARLAPWLPRLEDGKREGVAASLPWPTLHCNLGPQSGLGQSWVKHESKNSSQEVLLPGTG